MQDKRRKKVLIVDDEVFISEQLSAILKGLGYEVQEIAFDAESAINSLKVDAPDIAILDIKMHGENQGFIIAKYIKDHLEIPYIFLTSFADESTVQEASKLEPDGYVLKPFNERDIFSTLNIILNKYIKKVKYIGLKVGHNVHKVKIEDFLWVKSSDKYIEIQTSQRSYIKRDGIESFIASNKLLGLIRVHRSYAVKIDKVDGVNGSTLLINNHEIPISKKYEKAFKEAYLLN